MSTVPQIQERRVPSPNTLKFCNLCLRSRGRSVVILRFERQWPGTGWLNLKQTVSPIYWCVFFCIFSCYFVSALTFLPTVCLCWLPSSISNLPLHVNLKRWKSTLIVLFSHLSPSFSVKGIFLTAKGNASFHLNMKQIEIHFSMSKFQGLQYLWQERKQLDRWSISVKLKS